MQKKIFLFNGDINELNKLEELERCLESKNVRIRNQNREIEDYLNKNRKKH